MARIFIHKCPKCGAQFEAQKGVLVNWGAKPIPEEWQEETPIHCPNCNHAMNVEDDDFMNHVITAMFAD